MIDTVTVRAAAERVQNRIAAAGGDPARVRLVAVTKGFGPDVVAAAHAAGIADVAESYAQEMVLKVRATDGLDVRWHFVGGLQRNKVRALAPMVELWQSVDRQSLGAEIARWAPGARVLVQVNVSGRSGRAGCSPNEAADLVGFLGGAGLRVQGVMGVASPDPALAERELAGLASLADRLGLQERSMGMSDDLEVAVRAGTTMVRVGTALFGPRPERRQLRR